MAPMPRPPLIVAAASVAAAFWWSVHLALDPAPIATAPAVVLALSSSIGAVVLTIGLLISRARWAKPTAIALAAAGLAVAMAAPIDAGTVVGAMLSGVALAGALGPWLTTWLRRLPSAEAPPRSAALAVASAGLLPALVAVVRFRGMGAADAALAGVAALTALGLLRASTIALWLARLVVPATGIAAGIAAGLPTGPILTAAGAAAAWPAWRSEVGLSVRPILPSSGNVSVPPELADPGLLAAAGYDDRGRPTGRSS